MECISCPYIKDELELYMNRFGYAEMEDNPGFEEDVIEMIAETCWCDKIGHRIGLYGQCT